MVLGQKGYHVPKDCQIVGHESAAWRERAITHKAAKRPSIQVPFGMAQKDVAVICPRANDSATLKRSQHNRSKLSQMYVHTPVFFDACQGVGELREARRHESHAPYTCSGFPRGPPAAFTNSRQMSQHMVASTSAEWCPLQRCMCCGARMDSMSFKSIGMFQDVLFPLS